LLRGYVRQRIKGERFPGLYSASGVGVDNGGVVRGLVLDDLTDNEAAIFDEFEDDEYNKECVRPILVEGIDESTDVMAWGQTPPVPSDVDLEGKAVSALAYVWTEKGMLDDVAWLPERDFIPYESEYIDMCKAFFDEELPEDMRRLTYKPNDQVEMKLSRKKSVGFYVKAARALLTGTSEQEPVKMLRVSALKSAVGMAVSVATKLEADGNGTISRVRTDYRDMGDKGRNRCACIDIDVIRVERSQQ